MIDLIGFDDLDFVVELFLYRGEVVVVVVLERFGIWLLIKV